MNRFVLSRKNKKSSWQIVLYFLCSYIVICLRPVSNYYRKYKTRGAYDSVYLKELSRLNMQQRRFLQAIFRYIVHPPYLFNKIQYGTIFIIVDSGIKHYCIYLNTAALRRYSTRKEKINN